MNALGWQLSANPPIDPFLGLGVAPAHSPLDSRHERSLGQHGFFQRRMLYCRTGYNLHIWPDGVVNGTVGKYGVLQFFTMTTAFTALWLSTEDKAKTKVSIKGEASNLWLCMNAAGQLYGSAKKTNECEFTEEVLDNYYNTYYSAKYQTKTESGTKRWYVALGYDGRSRLGHMSRWRHRMSQFLPRSLRNGDTLSVPVNVQTALLSPLHSTFPSSSEVSPPSHRRNKVAGRRKEERRKRPGDSVGEMPRSSSKSSSPLVFSVDAANKIVSVENGDKIRYSKQKLEPHKRRTHSTATALKSLSDLLRT